MAAEQVKANKCFDGFLRRYKHQSQVLGCAMHFTVYHPPAAETARVPVLFCLSGLTCTDENFMQKAGAQRAAAAHGIALVAPDTSPRGLDVPGENDSYDFGVGAGFYLNATEAKWKGWRMYDYIMSELPGVLRTLPSLDMDRVSVMGHSMGGHGALMLSLRNPSAFKSVSAFAPICNPCQVPWGKKALAGYLGTDSEAWKQYDSTELARGYSGPQLPVLIDTGTEDEYLQQLRPWAFEEAAGGKLRLESNMRAGYDHSYYTIATFVDSHLEFHAKHLF